MVNRFTIGVLAGLMIGSGVYAQVPEGQGYKPSGDPITNPAEPGYNPELVVCRNWTQTGSRALTRKLCLRNRQWEAVARDGNRYARNIVDNGFGNLQSGL